jgi:hypothetical protein
MDAVPRSLVAIQRCVFELQRNLQQPLVERAFQQHIHGGKQFPGLSLQLAFWQLDTHRRQPNPALHRYEQPLGNERLRVVVDLQERFDHRPRPDRHLPGEFPELHGHRRGHAKQAGEDLHLLGLARPIGQHRLLRQEPRLVHRGDIRHQRRDNIRDVYH